MGSGRGWLGLHLLNLKEKHIQSLIIKRLHRKRFSIAYVPGSFFCEKVTSSPSFSLTDSSASETRARVKINLFWISLSKRYSCAKSWPKVTCSPSFLRWTSARLGFRAAVSLNLRNTNEKHTKEPTATHAQARFTALRTGTLWRRVKKQCSEQTLRRWSRATFIMLERKWGGVECREINH